VVELNCNDKGLWGIVGLNVVLYYKKQFSLIIE